MTEEAKGRAAELGFLETRMRQRMDYSGWRRPEDREQDLCIALLYMGMCMRDLTDTLVGRIER